LGMKVEDIVRKIDDETLVCFIYCRTMAESLSVTQMIKSLKQSRPDIKIILFENNEAVTSYSLRAMATRFFNDGCDFLILGDPERTAVALIDCLSRDEKKYDVSGVVFKQSNNEVVFPPYVTYEKNLDQLPLPAWELFTLEGYWDAGFAHAPIIRGERFISILTSRGCPYKCSFCIAPAVNNIWRSRSALNVFYEMNHFYRTMGIADFHVSDLNPTVNEGRIRELCNIILKNKLPVTWKLAQGTKIETIKHESTLDLMAKAGCKYISFSPESGSKKIMKSVNKPFDFDHALKMLKKMNKLGIRSQACFIAGLPGENDLDRKDSLNYLKKLIFYGLDELNVPIFTPVPGAELSESIKGYSQYAQCTFSPTWREDYSKVRRFRYRMYLSFFIHKLMHPRKVFREILGFMRGSFETKMEMSFFKLIKLIMLRYCPGYFN